MKKKQKRTLLCVYIYITVGRRLKAASPWIRSTLALSFFGLSSPSLSLSLLLFHSFLLLSRHDIYIVVFSVVVSTFWWYLYHLYLTLSYYTDSIALAAKNITYFLIFFCLSALFLCTFMCENLHMEMLFFCSIGKF